MSQTIRVARMNFLLKQRGYVRTREIMDEYEVSRETVMRDVAYLRDQLRAPLVYDPRLNAYIYEASDNKNDHVRAMSDLPGLWLDNFEAYALLTLLNLTHRIDPGIFTTYTAPSRYVLKSLLGNQSFSMKGFHKKIAVDIPGLDDYDEDVATRLGKGLIEERRVAATWRLAAGTQSQAEISVQQFRLEASGWVVIFLDHARGDTAERAPLGAFTDCQVLEAASELLPEYQSDVHEDLQALHDTYRSKYRRD